MTGIATKPTVVSATHKAVLDDMAKRRRALANMSVVSADTMPNMAVDTFVDSLSKDEACSVLADRLSQPGIGIDTCIEILSGVSIEEQVMVLQRVSPERYEEFQKYYRRQRKDRNEEDYRRIKELANDSIEAYCDIILLSDSISKYVQMFHDAMKDSNFFLTNQYKYKYSKFCWQLRELRNQLQEYVVYLDTNRLMPRMTQFLSHYASEYYGNGTYTFYAQQKWCQENKVEMPLYEKCKEAIASIGSPESELEIWSALLVVRCLIEVCIHSIAEYNRKAVEYNKKQTELYNEDIATHTHLGIALPRKPQHAWLLRPDMFSKILMTCDRILSIRFTANYFNKVQPIIIDKYHDYGNAIKDYETIFEYLNPVIDNVVREYAYYFFTMAMLDIRNGKGIHDDVKNDIRYLHQTMTVRDDFRKELKLLNTLIPTNMDIEDMTERTRELLETKPEKFKFINKTIDLLFKIRSNEDVFPYDDDFLVKFNELGLIKKVMI